MKRLVIEPNERRQIEWLVDDVLNEYGPWDPVQFVTHAKTVAESLPIRVRQFFRQVQSDETDVAVLSGLPLSQDLAPTPTGWDMAQKTGVGCREEVVLMLSSAALGEPFGWGDQQNGHIMHDVCPAPGKELSETSGSSTAALSLHTEDAFHQCRCDYVALYCLRNPDRIGTTVVRADRLDLPPQLSEILSEKRFHHRPDQSHIGPQGHSSGAVDVDAILFGPPESRYLRIDFDDTCAAEEGDRAAQEAIAELYKHVCDAMEKVVLEPGDAIFLDNYRVAHGREPFSPRYDGTDRWLKRANLIRDIRRVFMATESRSRVIA
ncbi:TauD/TfdA family dioxygenase [Kitasatospora kifunensis]|uniref:Fe(II)/alpha-ketoglutarate-dependent arginine beta-hydroxylase n=1 Tax=Kitasatospora kifunensis TaxID=58351 RepID=A0A7W7R6C0_KITKI|nr:TauD/TfdA family dioxygenase [Kitasatospora kifunensis]MBB4926120.1 Fe(II)/alpha-ketoglutarate-dependent arginine beta-hydroxylase [Kitasatospora kifunensis]